MFEQHGRVECVSRGRERERDSLLRMKMTLSLKRAVLHKHSLSLFHFSQNFSPHVTIVGRHKELWKTFDGALREGNRQNKQGDRLGDTEMTWGGGGGREHGGRGGKESW